MPPGQIWALKTSCESPPPSHPHPNPSEHSAIGLRSRSVAESLRSYTVYGEAVQIGVTFFTCFKIATSDVLRECSDDLVQCEPAARKSGRRSFNSSALGSAGKPRLDGNQIWLRHGAMRCLYRPPQWGSDTVLRGPSVAGRGQGGDDHRGPVAGPQSSVATRLDGRRRTAVRLLSIGTIDERRGPVARKAATER